MNYAPLPASAAVHVAAALILLLPAGIAPSVQVTTGALIAVTVPGTVTSGFMDWISMRLMREIPASAATSAAFMIPFFGVSWRGLFLGEPVTATMMPRVFAGAGGHRADHWLQPFQRRAARALSNALCRRPEISPGGA